MGWGKAVLATIAQHRRKSGGMALYSRCKACFRVGALQPGGGLGQPLRPDLPSPVGGGLTPHETLSIIFAQHKARFDSVVLGAFIRMMGRLSPRLDCAIGE